VYRSDTQEIIDHRGRPMDWIFYSWGVSLTHEGSSLAAECLIDLLSGFESVQVAGIGMTGLPLASAIVSLGQGKYSGLYVRPAREAWGTQRTVEGPGDKTKPVVVVDDCICSGGSLKTACAALEADGYRVEGAVCLVNFPWKGGMEWARSLGYRVETLFESAKDLEDTSGQPVPGYRDVAVDFDQNTVVPEGLSPADMARWVAEKYLADGTVPSPPIHIVGQHHDARGGVVVSFRDRATDFRVARDGFYHLNASEADLGRDIVLATIKALRSSRGAVATYGMDRLKVGVTFYGQQVPASFRQLDFARHGVLVQSTDRPWKFAGALPNTQFFTSEIEQLRHARFTNTKLFPIEPYRLFSHTVSKSVETGNDWPPFGTSEPPERHTDADAVGAALTARARAVLNAVAEGREPGSDGAVNTVVSGHVDGVTVALYHRGLIGCWVCWQGDLDTMVRNATTDAWNDKRWERPPDLRTGSIDIVVSTLRRAEVLGPVSIERAAFVLRLGKDTLGVRKNGRVSILLAYIPCHNNWSKVEMAGKLLEKAGLTQLPDDWLTYFTQSWLDKSGHVWPLESGFPRRPAAPRPPKTESETEVIRSLASYIADKIGPSCFPDYSYYPTSDRAVVAESAPRPVLALSALSEAARFLGDDELSKKALAGLTYCCDHITGEGNSARLSLPGMPCGVMAEVFLLHAAYRTRDRSITERPALRDLLSRFLTFFHSDGAITWLAEGRRIDSEHDLFPGAALHMVAHLFESGVIAELPPFLPQHLEWYQNRFRWKPSWGMMFWQTQGWAAIHRATSGRYGQEFVYELADWALDRQLDKNGAFLVDYALDGPGFHTGVVLEALADAWQLARRVGDTERASRYQDAWHRGRSFLDRLVLREEDTFAMRQPHRAIGGLRGNLTSSAIRIDYVAHALLALLKGLYVKQSS
jgi:orotate phosphoribosyltransferase